MRSQNCDSFQLIQPISYLANSQEDVGRRLHFFKFICQTSFSTHSNWYYSIKKFLLFKIRRGLLSVRVLRIRCILCIEPNSDDTFLGGHKCWKKPELCHADEKWKNHGESCGIEFLWHVSLSWNNTRCVGKLHSSSLERWPPCDVANDWYVYVITVHFSQFKT